MALFSILLFLERQVSGVRFGQGEVKTRAGDLEEVFAQDLVRPTDSTYTLVAK